MRLKIKNNFNKGFTLVELLVVISIIGLLASILLVAVSSARENARLKAGLHFASQVDDVAGDQSVGLWDFNECQNSTIGDSSNYGSNGSAVGALAWSSDTPSGSGCSMIFTGGSEVVNIPNPSNGVLDFGASNDFSFSVWVKPIDVSNGPFIIDKRHTFGGASAGYTLRLDNLTGRPCLRIGDGTNGPYDICGSSGNFIDSKWHQYAISVVRSSGAVSIYVDGHINGTGTLGTLGNITNAQPLYIGSKDGTVGNVLLSGSIDSVHIFAKALLASDVQKLYVQESSSQALVAEK